MKGLSIEHEKLAVAQSQTTMDTSLDSPTSRKQLKVMKEEIESSPNLPQSSPSPSSYSPAMSPYMHPHHYRQYEQRMPTTGASFETAHKRPLRSPSEMLQESVRASVLRDGSKAGRPPSPGPMSLAYRPSSSSSSSLPQQPEADAAPPENRFDPDPAATALVCPESNSIDRCNDPDCPEDLRMKMDSNTHEEQQLSSTVPPNGNNASANGSLDPMSTYEQERNKADMMPTTLWNSVTGKLGHKTGSSVTTADGKFFFTI